MSTPLGLLTRGPVSYTEASNGASTYDYDANMALLDKLSARTARIDTTIAAGASSINLLWNTPFADNTYFVLFGNPPFAPGAIQPAPPMIDHTDAFTSSLNPAWLAQDGTFDIDGTLHSLEAKTVTSPASRVSMGYTDSNWGLNQFSQVKVTQLESVTSGAIGPALYVSDLSYYAFFIAASVAYLFKQVGDVTTVLSSAAATLSLNDVLRLEIAANTLVAKQNGTAILTAFETSPLSLGAAGVQGYLTSDFRVNNWEGGNLVNLPVIPKPVLLGPWTYLPNGTGINMVLSNLNTTPLEVRIDVVGLVGN